MSKILKYDSEGNEVYFHHAVDAKEAVASGQFFDSNPKKKDELVKEEPKKNNKKKEEEVPNGLTIDNEKE